jgi:8-amino-7-oxononanoate synthase
MDSLDRFAKSKLDSLTSKGLRRRVIETVRSDAAGALRQGRHTVSFCCNDYLGLSLHQAVRDAAAQAITRYGAGAGASRLVTGNHPLYRELEERLARLKGTEDACVFGSGYLANIGIVPTLAGGNDLIVVDELVHACLHAGARLSGAKTVQFRHNDIADCKRILTEERARHPRCLVLVEGIYSMDGDLAPVGELADLAASFDAWLLTDDAHGLGVVGKGRGSTFAGKGVGATGGMGKVPLQMGTLSKAVGSYGGYLCASKPVVDLLRTRARSFIYTTGLPPASVAASIAALDLIAGNPELVARPLRLARAFAAALGLAEPQSPILPIILGDSGRAMAAERALFDKGFLVTAIRPPTVPEGTARLRLTFSAAHRDNDVQALIETVRELGLADGTFSPQPQPGRQPA